MQDGETYGYMNRYIYIWYMGVSWESIGDIKQGGVNEDDQ